MEGKLYFGSDLYLIVDQHSYCHDFRFSDKNRRGRDDYYGMARTTVPEVLGAANNSLELVIEEQIPSNRWADGMFVTVKCRKLA